MTLSPIQALVESLGIADQQARENERPDWQLALRRANLRVALSAHSRQVGEQNHLLGEAVALLELTRLDLEEKSAYVQVSVGLAQTYLALFALRREGRYLTIAAQVLRPLSATRDALLLLTLARVDAAAGRLGLARHWLSRCAKLPDVSIADWDAAPELKSLHHQPWWPALRQQLLH